MNSTTTVRESLLWLILPNPKGGSDTLVAIDNISHVVQSEDTGHSFVYLKSHGYAVETTLGVAGIIEIMRECT